MGVKEKVLGPSRKQKNTRKDKEEPGRKEAGGHKVGRESKDREGLSMQPLHTISYCRSMGKR